MHQRRLAGSGRAHDGGEGTREELDRDPPQSVNRSRTLSVALLKVPADDDRAAHIREHGMGG